MPATVLIKTDTCKIRKKEKTGRRSDNAQVNCMSVNGPEIVKSLHEVSDLLQVSKVV